jgi:hypothetical protein
MAIKRQRTDIKKVIKKRIEDRHNKYIYIDKRKMDERTKLRIYGKDRIAEFDKERIVSNIKPELTTQSETTRKEKRTGIKIITKELTLNYNRYVVKSIGVIIVNYNQLKLTKDCINSLKKQINLNFKIYLFDQNSSEQGTFEYLEECEKNNIFVYRNSTNIPLNYIWNDFKKICDLEYLCFLNNDTVLSNMFIDDNIKIFEKEPAVGAIIHATNNSNYLKSKDVLEYIVFKNSLYQGWDYCVRREIMPDIPSELKIFGGDDYIFAKINSLGHKVAIAFSSPIIHYKEKTRETVSNIAEIQREDGKNFRDILNREKLSQIDITISYGYCNKFPLPNMKLTQNKNCVFTAIIGDYDSINPTHFQKLNDWDYICFTDNVNMKSDFWRVIYVENCGTTLLDNVKLARYFKTNFHKHLSSYENLLWIDARITLIGNINEYVKKLQKNDIVFLKHPDAPSIKQEFDRVLSGNIETKEMVMKIKKRYEEFGYKYNNGLISSGVLLFKNNELTIKFFKDWWHEIENYSHRDQLSANFALWRNNKIRYEIIGGLINVYFKQLPRNTKPFRYE